MPRQLGDDTAPTLDATPPDGEKTTPLESVDTSVVARSIGLVVGGRYRLDAVLGQGGFGAVYRAHDLVVDRDVAIKLLRAGTADVAERSRFLREARATGRLHHDRIVALFDAGEAPEGLFLVLELVAGRPLDAILRDGQFTPETAIAVARQVAEALAAAHAVGIVHRDVKPANVLVDERGSVKVADFGIAQIADETRLTSTGNVVGTPSYMAPEQVDGREVGPPADLFALGCVLQEMLTGRPPFRGKTQAEVLARIQRGSPEPLPDELRESRPELVSLVGRLLKKSPDARPAGAATVAQELADLAAGKRTGRTTTGEMKRPRRRFGAVLLFGAVVVVALSVLLIRQPAERSAIPVEPPRFDAPVPTLLDAPSSSSVIATSAPSAAAPEVPPAASTGKPARPKWEVPLLSPAADAVVRLDWQEPPSTIAFRWIRVVGAVRYRIRIRSLEGSGKTVLEEELTSTAISASLEPGVHQWTVTALDEAGAILAESEPHRTFFARSEPIRTIGGAQRTPNAGIGTFLLAPSPDAIVAPAPKEKIRFAWNPVARALRYRLTLKASTVHVLVDARDRTGSAVRDLALPAPSLRDPIERETRGTFLEIEVSPGRWSWTVTAEGSDGFLRSESRALVVVPAATAPSSGTPSPRGTPAPSR